MAAFLFRPLGNCVWQLAQQRRGWSLQRRQVRPDDGSHVLPTQE